MKCQHGRVVKVSIETYSPICWDDGIRTFDRNGRCIQNMAWDKRPKDNKEFLEVIGCPHCELIQMSGR